MKKAISQRLVGEVDEEDNDSHETTNCSDVELGCEPFTDTNDEGKRVRKKPFGLEIMFCLFSEIWLRQKRHQESQRLRLWSSTFTVSTIICIRCVVYAIVCCTPLEFAFSITRVVFFPLFYVYCFFLILICLFNA